MKSLVSYDQFWHLFDEILQENGEPFKIKYRPNQYYSDVNRNKPFNTNAVDLTVYKDGRFRINLYMHNGLNSEIGQKIYSNKELVGNMISKPILWENGVKNKTTMRPSVYFKFNMNDYYDCRRVIEESLPTIIEFIEVANKFGKYDFFDF